MNKALLINHGKASVILPHNISSRKDYLEHFAGKLFCPTDGCNAKLDYVELSYFGIRKIFRTHKGSEHLTTCPYCITHKTSDSPAFSSETFSQALSDEHIKSILKGLYQRNITPALTSTPVTKHGTTKHHANSQTTSTTGRAIASIDPNAAPIVKGEREPSVRKRRSLDLLPEDNNQLRGIDGIVDSAYIGDNYIELHFCTNGTPISLLFYNAFRDESEQAYRHILTLATLLNSTNLSLLVCCLGVVEVEGTKTTIQIMSPDYITFEGLPIFNYMALQAS